MSQLLRGLYRLLGVQSITTTPSHPATDGLMERYNRIVKNMIHINSKLWQDQWDLALPFLLGELRQTPSATTGWVYTLRTNAWMPNKWTTADASSEVNQ